jgi:hypothetical protein
MGEYTQVTFEGYHAQQQSAATSVTLAATNTTKHHSPHTSQKQASVPVYLSHAERCVVHDLLGQPGALVLGAVLAQPGGEPGHALEALWW